jgi:hypothetical protein
MRELAGGQVARRSDPPLQVGGKLRNARKIVTLAGGQTLDPPVPRSIFRPRFSPAPNKEAVLAALGPHAKSLAPRRLGAV